MEIEALLRELIEKVDRLEAKIDGKLTKYPAPIMKLSELKSIGFPETWLMKVYRKGRNKIAWKSSNAPNAPILFDTALLEKERQAECVGGY